MFKEILLTSFIKSYEVYIEDYFINDKFDKVYIYPNTVKIIDKDDVKKIIKGSVLIISDKLKGDIDMVINYLNSDFDVVRCF